MIKKTKQFIKKVPGKSHHHAILGIFLGVLAIGFSLVAIKNSSEAQASMPCTYKLSAWSVCSPSGKQTRTIIDKVPSGCTESEVPKLERSCTYVANTPSSENINPDNVLIDKTAVDNSLVANNSEEVTPKFNFLNLNEGEVIRGEVNIQGMVDAATDVEFYLVPAGSNNPKYLGLAKLIREKVWEYKLDSTQQPNGAFYIYAKIKNIYGVYEGEKRMLIILNANEEMQQAIDNSVNNENRASIEWYIRYFKSDNCLDQNICGGEADPDGDGVTNNEEYRLGSNPTNADTDQDGFIDGDEIKSGFNPVKASPGDKSDKMVFESPKEKGEIKKDLYKVDKVELVDDKGKKKLKLNGKALPNSYVTIYIYSDPIVLTVKTDKDGNWSYVLDKDIEDGDHEVYVAVTDNTGKITAKSEPVAFVKTAQAANIVLPAEAEAENRAVSPTKAWSNSNLYFFVTIAIGVLALAVATLGLIKHNLSKKDEANLV